MFHSPVNYLNNKVQTGKCFKGIILINCIKDINKCSTNVIAICVLLNKDEHGKPLLFLLT